MQLRKKIRNAEALQDAKRLVQAGADTEIVVAFLRERGCDQADCIYALEALYGTQFSEAKNLVIHSRAWSDQYEADERLRAAAREALRHLAADPSSNIPRIIVEWDKEKEKD